MAYNEKNNEENNEEIASAPDYSRYGKIEMDYIEAGRQLVRLEIVRGEVASMITDAISAIQELAGLVECECSINASEVVDNNLNSNVDEIMEKLNYEIKGYQNLAIEIGADINDLNSAIVGAVRDNSKDYQTALRKSRLYGKKFVYYNQYAYKNVPYGDSTIADSGCGPTCAAMILSTLYDESITPQVTCDYSASNGYLGEGGTYPSFFGDIFTEYGVAYTTKEQTADNIISVLEEGNIIVANMGPGTFTKSGHYIVLTGINENGEIMIQDPADSSKNNKTWPASVFENERIGSMYVVSP